jgi:hypothetical protein
MRRSGRGTANPASAPSRIVPDLPFASCGPRGVLTTCSFASKASRRCRRRMLMSAKPHVLPCPAVRPSLTRRLLIQFSTKSGVEIPARSLATWLLGMFLLVAPYLLSTAVEAEQSVAPDVASLLFDTPQWTGTEGPTSLSYRYLRKSSDAEAFGPSFEDRIQLKVEPGDQPQARTVSVQMFSGERHLAAGPFENVTFNPALVLFLENHVQQLSRSLHANPRYLKNAIRKAWREKASVTEADIEIDGKRFAGTRISVQPFIDDPNKARTNGLDALTLTVNISQSVPGRIASIVVEARRPDGTPVLDESLVYDQKAE